MNRGILLLGLSLGCAGPRAPSTAVIARTPTFFENDYAGALAQARSRGKPLFIDAWATWCHTCLSMREFVFRDPALARQTDAFVWLAMDTEKPESAAFLERYPMSAWPTLWVVDSATETPRLKWQGAATGAELATLLDDVAKPGAASGEAGAAHLRGTQAAASGNLPGAASELRDALRLAPAGWRLRPRTTEALTSVLHDAKEHLACAAVARSELGGLPPGTSRANVLLTAMACARSAHADSSDFVKLATNLALDRTAPLLADDRSGVFDELVSTHTAQGDEAATQTTAQAWLSFLEEEVSRAHTPAARAVFDAHRVLALVALGRPRDALGFLAESERAFPLDYNPPARLARVYLSMGQHIDALSAVDRALARVYGPRELRIRSLRADIQLAHGDRRAAKETLEETLARANAMPALPGSYGDLKADLARKLDGLSKEPKEPR